MISAMDFAVLPPEINSARMYAGPGAEPLMAAAAAWDGVAAELSSAATMYRSVIAQLTGGPWLGVSSTTMAAAVAPYLSWMNAAATQAEQTANQARAAAAAYEAAFAATVPPPEIELNRALSAILVATNVLGQNTAAIAAAEAQYTQMWAEDAAAMYGYAGASAAATELTPFAAPPQTTNPAGASTQGAAVTQITASAAGQGAQLTLSQVISSVPSTLQSLASGAATDPISNLVLAFFNSGPVQAFETLSNNAGGLQYLSFGANFLVSGTMLTFLPYVTTAEMPLYSALSAPVAAVSDTVPAAGLEGGLESSLVDSYGSTAGGAAAGLGGTGVAADLGQGATVGKLSVPPAWGAAAPEIRLTSAATALPGAALEALPQAGGAAPGVYGMPPMGPVASVVNAPRGEQSRSKAGSGYKVIPALAGESGMQEDFAARWGKPNTSAADDAAASERDELNQLRRAMADLSRKRDLLKRTAATLINESAHK